MNNKLAIVTGGAKGLGKAIALELAENSIDIILQYNTSEVQACLTAEEIKKKGVKVYLVKADFSVNKEIEEFISTKVNPILSSENRKIDILVNNAGVSQIKRFGAINTKEFDDFFSINVKAPLFLMRDCYAVMNNNGRVINISSTTVTRPYEKMVIYGASKAAFDNISKSVIKDFGKKDITVNSIAPGFIPTDMNNLDVSNPMLNQFILKNSAIKKIGSAVDVAKLVMFLVSDDASWINGQNIEISGGVIYN